MIRLVHTERTGSGGSQSLLETCDTTFMASISSFNQEKDTQELVWPMGVKELGDAASESHQRWQQGKAFSAGQSKIRFKLQPSKVELRASLLREIQSLGKHKSTGK